MNAALILGCSRRKRRDVAGSLAAIDLYEGGGIPEIRALIRSDRYAMRRTFILSGKYGLLSALEPIAHYDVQLTPEAAVAMRPSIRAQVESRIFAPLRPTTLYVLAEPLYFSLLALVLDSSSLPRIIWEPDIAAGLPAMIVAIRQLQQP